jgi:cellulose biosynthesis protein BcsQ
MKELPRVAFFNHKGGVGKTVLTANVSQALAQKNRRILVVDTDPQCNITSYLLPDKKVDALLDRSDESNGQTLWTGVKPLSDGGGGVRYIEPIEVRHNLHLLAGDIQLFRFEDDLSSYWADSFRRKLRGLNGMAAISDVVSTVCERHEFDLIFYDCGPNIGALNRAVILDCDGFIVPVACDLFSLRALRTLGQALYEWITDWQTVIDLAPSGVELLVGRPALLGFVPQQFRTYGGVPEQAASSFIARIERQLLADVATPLRRINSELVATTGRSLQMGEVRELGSLVAQSLQQRLPLWSVDGGNAQKKAYAKREFVSLADELWKRLF